MSHTANRVNTWTAILLLGFSLFLVGINRLPVPTLDGAIRASMARNIVETGKWYPTQYLGQTFIDHPPLYVWLTAVSFKAFGVSDFAANFPVRIFAFLVILLTALIAVEFSGSLIAALLSAIVLATTRDFVLSSVRGYIEPLLEVFFLLSFYLCLRQIREKKYHWSFLAGLSLFAGAFAKGPPAIWPLLFCLGLLLWFKRQKASLALVGGVLAGATIWFAWVDTSSYWVYWKSYLYDQVLNSALKGRDGAQEFDRFYFLKILAKTYWPWLPLLVFSVIQSARSPKKKVSLGILISFIFGFGFVAGFSLVRWKFWYYIAPAYPAFAICLGLWLSETLKSKVDIQKFSKAVITACGVWILIASVFPIRLHHDRVPEVGDFKSTIRNSSKEIPVFFISQAADHNLIGTSGEWSFHRTVHKATPKSAPAWIITDPSEVSGCEKPWCSQSTLIQSSSRLVLLLWKGTGKTSE